MGRRGGDAASELTFVSAQRAGRRPSGVDHHTMNGQHGELEMTPAIAAVSSPCPAGHAKRPLRPFRLLWVVRDPTTAKTVLARDTSSCAAATSQHRPDSGAGQQLFRGWPGMDSMWTLRMWTPR